MTLLVKMSLFGLRVALSKRSILGAGVLRSTDLKSFPVLRVNEDGYFYLKINEINSLKKVLRMSSR